MDHTYIWVIEEPVACTVNPVHPIQRTGYDVGAEAVEIGYFPYFKFLVRRWWKMQNIPPKVVCTRCDRPPHGMVK